MWLRLAIVALLLSLPASATIALEGSATGNNTTGSTSVTTGVRSWTSGNAIIVGMVINSTSASVTCTLTSNTVTLIRRQTFTAMAVNTYYIANVTAVSAAVSCSWTGSQKAAIVALEYSGLDTVDILDVQSSNTGATANPTCGTTATTNTADELVVTFLGIVNNPSVTAGSGYVLEASDQATSTPKMVLADKTVGTFGTQTGGYTAAANNWACVIATFKASPGTVTATAATITGTGADDSAVGTRAWTNPTNIQASDNTRTQLNNTTADAAVLSHYLKATNFGFSIPAAAAIAGVKVEFERYKVTTTALTDCTGSAQMDETTVKLVLSGTVSGNNRASTTAWTEGSGTEAFVTYGGQADMWGVAQTATNWNASTSGVVMSLTHTGCVTGGHSEEIDAFLDSVRVTVYYVTSGSEAADAGPVIAQTRYAGTIEVGR